MFGNNSARKQFIFKALHCKVSVFRARMGIQDKFKNCIITRIHWIPFLVIWACLERRKNDVTEVKFRSIDEHT